MVLSIISCSIFAPTQAIMAGIAWSADGTLYYYSSVGFTIYIKLSTVNVYGHLLKPIMPNNYSP